MKTRFFLLATLLYICQAASAAVPSLSLIPLPEHMEQCGGTSSFAKKFTIRLDSKASAEVEAVVSRFSHEFCTATAMDVQRTRKSSATMTLSLDAALASEAYTLEVAGGKVRISAAQPAGFFYALQTFKQLFPRSVMAGQPCTDIKTVWTVPDVRISDAPRFAWRGFMLDEGRHFYGKETIKRVLDLMSVYKMNRFHWHLTEDQGWRVEIKKYPRLTEVGAWRNSKVLGWGDVKPDGQRYGGFYTHADVKEIVAYAAERGIDVIPELDMPGHSLAAIQCVGGLSCSEDTRWGRLFSTPMCPGKDTMLEFCKNVWTEVFGLFPYEYVHIGGDEVDMKNWRACADCQRRMKDNGLSSEPQLQTWFNHYMEDFFRAHGRKMIAWDDVVDGGLSPYTTVMWWRSWLPKGPKRATSHGNDLIDVPVSYFYLSGRDDPSKMEGIYRFDPYATLNAEESQRVRGIHSCLWGERIASAERMWYQLFPRFMAVAERAWSRPERMDYEDFCRRMLKHLPRLEAMGIQYRLPDVTGLIRTAVFTDSDTVSVACIDPSVSIHYTTDGTMPQVSSPKYTGPIAVSQTTHFIFRPFGADGRKGDAVSTSLVKTTMAEAVGVDGELLPGLRNVWYDYGGDNCAGIEKAQIKGEYVTDGVVIPREARENIGLVITGYIEVPHDGIYSFALYSDDGSQLIIDDKMVVDSDGMHDIMEVTGQHAMKAGLHPLRATYFDHNGGDLRLTVKDKHGKKVEVKYWHK